MKNILKAGLIFILVIFPILGTLLAGKIFTALDSNTVKTPKIIKEDSKDGSLVAKINSGKQVYSRYCLACHQANGEGISGIFPPLAKSDYLNADIDRAIDIIINGKAGEIIVNGDVYNSVMAKQPISNEEVANVLTYILNSWENKKVNVSISQVKKVRTTQQ